MAALKNHMDFRNGAVKALESLCRHGARQATVIGAAVAAGGICEVFRAMSYGYLVGRSTKWELRCWSIVQQLICLRGAVELDGVVDPSIILQIMNGILETKSYRGLAVNYCRV